jgi:hypothetical protein
MSCGPTQGPQTSWRLAENGKIAPFGATPYRSVGAIIEEAILKAGDDCPFVKTYPGVYILRQNASPAQLRVAKTLPPDLCPSIPLASSRATISSGTVTV